jgi:hypothetical protein
MTREEALAKMAKWRHYGDDAAQGWLLDNLEALGLLQFEMISSISPSMIIKGELCKLIPSGLVTQPMQNADNIINALYRNGYVIARKEEIK